MNALEEFMNQVKAPLTADEREPANLRYLAFLLGEDA